MCIWIYIFFISQNYSFFLVHILFIFILDPFPSPSSDSHHSSLMPSIPSLPPPPQPTFPNVDKTPPCSPLSPCHFLFILLFLLPIVFSLSFNPPSHPLPNQWCFKGRSMKSGTNSSESLCMQVIKRFHRNQKDVGMAVVNKQGHHYSTLLSYNNHPYISSCSRYLRLAPSYVGMVM